MVLKILLFIWITAIIVPLLFRFSKRKRGSSYSDFIQVAMILSDRENENVLQLNTNQSTVSLRMDLMYRSTYAAQFRMYLLSDFESVPYAMNDGPVQGFQEVRIAPSEEILCAQNQIRIENLSRQVNDLCIVLVGMDHDLLFKKRFQILYEKGEKAAREEDMKMIPTAGETKHSSTPLSDFSAVQLDFGRSIKEEAYQKAFLADPAPFTVAAVLFEEAACAFTFLGYAEAERKPFALRLPPFPREGRYRLLLFPYPDQYEKSFLYTYKAMLWSSPLAVKIDTKQNAVCRGAPAE